MDAGISQIATAMDAATRNSSEILDSLTLYMNKVRQAAITAALGILCAFLALTTLKLR